MFAIYEYEVCTDDQIDAIVREYKLARKASRRALRAYDRKHPRGGYDFRSSKPWIRHCEAGEALRQVTYGRRKRSE